MSDIFPKWTNQLPLKLGVAAILVGTAALAGTWYYMTPKYTRVGYQPVQPVGFSHAIHADQLGLDCRYCHNGVESSWFSNIPAASTCMNCHSQVLSTDPKLEIVRESERTGDPVPWVQIHKTPDYVYFNHSVHVNRGVSCVECHGEVNKMDEVHHAKPLSMSFCIECHRNPEEHLREPSEVYNLNYAVSPETQEKRGTQFKHDWNVAPSQSCSACHR